MPTDSTTRAQYINGILRTLAREPFSEDELKMFHRAIANRLPSKVCWKCGKLKLVVDGGYRQTTATATSKSFLCADCVKNY